MQGSSSCAYEQRAKGHLTWKAVNGEIRDLNKQKKKELEETENDKEQERICNNLL